jgi:Helix-hairpin-helix motif
MKKTKSLLLFLPVMVGLSVCGRTQDLSEFRREQLEIMAEKNDVVPTDDSYEMDLAVFAKHPMNLNTVSADDLIQLHLLNDLQIRNFLSYRKLLGSLLSVHELQAVPGWDLATIRQLLPYIIVGRDESVYSALKERWKHGDASILIRAGQVLEKSKGFEKPSGPDASYYEGSAQNFFIRYNYNYKQLLSYGFAGEKDAGEPFFKGAQQYGFDFYSFHFFLRQAGIIRCLAMGDFTINMGQGLIQWQTFSSTKSSQAMAIKREAECIRPYHAAGEFNFHRGAAIGLQKGNWGANIFISSQRISTNMVSDTAGREDLFSSFQQSGYHRTPAEIADRNNNRQISAGANIRYTGEQFMIGLNCIHFHFSQPLQKKDEPYNLYSLKGTRLTDFSVDYSQTYRNLHLFGELAMDQWRHLAIVQGALISLSDKISLSFLYRNISVAYQSLYSDAFTENSVPNNEKGFYSGLSIGPLAGLQMNIYYDVFVFPWLKYQVDAPSAGRDLLFQTSYQPNKSWNLTVLYKNEMKTGNVSIPNSAMHGLATPVKQKWRIATDYIISRAVGFNSMMEFLWIDMNGLPTRHGYLGVTGFTYRKSGFSGNIAAALFETDDYDTRIYAYEPDILYHFSLPAFYGRGIHYYINIHQDFSRLMGRGPGHFKWSAWLKWGQTFYPGSTSIGTGLDEIPGNRKSEIKAQVLIQWQ